MPAQERQCLKRERKTMKIRELLSIESIRLNGSPTDKNQTIEQAIDLMCESGRIRDRGAYSQAVHNREKEFSTGVGGGIAIPHGRSAGVKKAGLAAMVIPNGVDYEALDGNPVQLVFLIAAPEEGSVHLEVLAKLSRMLMDESLVQSLIHASSAEEFMNILNAAEEKADEKEKALEAQQKADVAAEASDAPLILGVTGCPTGIAHTYMAAEAIEKAAKEMGYQVKVETRGSGGAKNILTPDEIKKARAIIVAADVKVPMDRFDGKEVLQVPVKDGVSKPKELVEKAAVGKAPVYHGNGAVEETGSTETGWHKVYKDLMNGVSHMLPFIVGGGIMIAISFMIDGFFVDMNSLAEEERALFGTITPAAAFFKNVGGVAFGFMLPVLAGYIAESIAERPGLVAGFVGGALAANGTSGFLGALLAGFLAGYIVNGLKKLFAHLPAALDGVKPMLLYPFFGVLLVGLLMQFVVEPPVGWLNLQMNAWLNSLNGTSSVILGAILGGMMALDMGGPFNKAAYVFGTAAITSGNYDIMAAVMIGGMVPPIAIALSSLIFKDKFTDADRKTAPTNFVMGLSFITEGAIPFAASDPLHVLPACALSSALAGALSMLFGCTLMAPHGGIFVFVTVGNPWMYLLALVIGSVTGALLLGLFRKKVKEPARA